MDCTQVISTYKGLLHILCWNACQRQESERSCICVLEVRGHVFVLRVYILPLLIILIFDFGIVPTVWYFLLFILFVHSQKNVWSSGNVGWKQGFWKMILKAVSWFFCVKPIWSTSTVMLKYAVENTLQL